MAAKTYIDRYKWMRIEWTPESGPLAGRTLRGGIPRDDSGIDAMIVDFPSEKTAAGKTIVAKCSDKPELLTAAEACLAHRNAEEEMWAEQARVRAEKVEAFERSEAGRKLRKEIDLANEIERVMQPDGKPVVHPPFSGPSDDDIRSLEGNEDIDDPHDGFPMTAAERAENRGFEGVLDALEESR